MTDETSEPPRDFDALTDAVRAFRDAREWRRFHTPKDLAVSIALEAAELLEHFQWKDDAEVREYLDDPAHLEAVASEMADVQILLASAADVLGIDLPAATHAKLAVNEQRYPVEKARGYARKYDRL